MLDQLVAEILFQVSRPVSESRYPIDSVAGEMKAIELVEYRHVERRSGRTLLPIAVDMKIIVVGPPVGKPMDQPWIPMESKDDRFV
jgi:hypothetical protein